MCPSVPFVRSIPRYPSGLAAAIVLTLVCPAAPGAAPLFQAARLAYGTLESRSIAVADFDDDGLPDVVASQPFVLPRLYPFHGNGDGALSPLPLVNIANVGALAAGDLDDDTLPDLVMTAAGITSVLLGNGDLTFAAPLIHGTAQSGLGWSKTVAIADLTGDAIPDVLVADTTDAVHVWPGVGDGTLEPPLVLSAPGGGVIEFVAAAHLDGDGHLDVVAGGDSIYVFLGTGGGAFSAADVYEAPGDVCLGFIDGDGVLDLVTFPEWLAGNGDGTFAAPVPMGGGLVGYSPTIADVDDDGNGDLLVLQSDGGIDEGMYVAVYPGDGTGGFGAMVRFRTTTYPAVIEPTDLDLDGKVDLVVPSFGSYPLEVFHGNGDGTFGVVRNADTPGDPVAVQIAEVTGDADADVLALCPTSATLRIFRGLGDGTLDAPDDLPTAGDPRRFALGDVDGDGRADLVTANGASNSISVFPGLAGGGFGARTDHALGSFAFDVTVADVNGDLIGDVVAIGSDGDVRVFAGQNGAPPGAPVVHPGAATTVSRVRVALVNADAFPDVLVFTNVGGAWGWRIYPGAAGGALGAPYDVACGGSDNFPGTGAVADVGGSAALDLLALDSQSQLAVRLGNGDGTFAPAQLQGTAAVFRRSRALAVGDLDGDGHADLFTGNLDMNGGAAALGDGSGIFVAESGYGSAGWPVDVALGDLDGDGHPDAVLANDNTSNITILMDSEAPTAAIAPVAGPVGRLAFARVWPVPARGGVLHASITLPARGEARLELLDVSGRSVAGQPLGSLEAGTRQVSLDLPGNLRPGIYWLRLTQGGRIATARVAVLR